MKDLDEVETVQVREAQYKENTCISWREPLVVNIGPCGRFVPTHGHESALDWALRKDPSSLDVVLEILFQIQPKKLFSDGVYTMPTGAAPAAAVAETQQGGMSVSPL